MLLVCSGTRSAGVYGVVFAEDVCSGTRSEGVCGVVLIVGVCNVM